MSYNLQLTQLGSLEENSKYKYLKYKQKYIELLNKLK